jgi:hypothetical protein
MPAAHIELCYSDFLKADYSGKIVAYNGVAVDKCVTDIRSLYEAWVERTQPVGNWTTICDDDDDDDGDGDDDDVDGDDDDDDEDCDDDDDEWYSNEQWNRVEDDEINMALSALSPPYPALACQSCLRPIGSLLLRAASACPLFDARSMRVRYLQPPMQLGFTLSQPSLELASLQPWCRDSTQRAQLLCCSCPLSLLVFRLARAANRREGSRSSELTTMARIMRRCVNGCAKRLWSGRKCESGDDVAM